MKWILNQSKVATPRSSETLWYMASNTLDSPRFTQQTNDHDHMHMVLVGAKSIYWYGVYMLFGWSARWVYLRTSVWIQPEPEKRVLDSDTSAEITHLARQPNTIYICSHVTCILCMFRIPLWAQYTVSREFMLFMLTCSTACCLHILPEVSIGRCRRWCWDVCMEVAGICNSLVVDALTAAISTTGSDTRCLGVVWSLRYAQRVFYAVEEIIFAIWKIDRLLSIQYISLPCVLEILYQ